MKATISISSKTLFLVLGIIVVVVLGYFTVKILFSGPSLVGKTFVSIPTIANPKIESMSFTKEGLMLEAEYSQATGKWTDLPVSGKYEISEDKMILTALGGMAITVTPIKWLSKDKYELVYNSDTITYVLKGSGEDVSLLNIEYLFYGSRFECCSEGTKESRIIFHLFRGGKEFMMGESTYSSITNSDSPVDKLDYEISGNTATVSDILGNILCSYTITFLNENKFILVGECGKYTFIKKEIIYTKKQIEEFNKQEEEIGKAGHC